MINVGIDAHKRTYVAVIKDQTAGILDQAEFSNTTYGIKNLQDRSARDMQNARFVQSARLRGTGFCCMTCLRMCK